MGKYKKKLRAEKAKVKLKKKKLPKGQNITDTTFTVKKIVTLEQLKKVHENEPVSSWNVPLKDLLIHLGHHNKSSRLNGLNGIKEIITNYPDVLKGPSLKNTVMKVLEMMSDIESQIRASAINLLDVIFSQLNSTEILAFHEVLNIHLACVMTHRQVAIQKDSLRLADIIIKYAPEAIKKNFKIIMVNFIRILSGYKYGAQSEIFLTRGSKRDLEENRIAIFYRLNRILNICYPDEPGVIEEENIVLNSRDVKAFSKKMFISHYKKTVDLSEIFRLQGTLYNNMTCVDFEEDFKSLMSQVMPLIFETWAEFSPSHENNGFFEECTIKESTAKLLGLSLDIIAMLCERSLKMENYELKKLFITNYGSQFLRLFLSSFPYVPQIMDKKVHKVTSVEEESAFGYSRIYQSQNLMICYIVYRMKLKISDELKKVLDNYVLQALVVRNTKCEEILCKIIELMILVPSKHKRVDTFLEASVRAFKHTTNENFQKRLLRILSKVASDDYAHSVVNPCVSDWFSYIAKGLCKSKISWETLQTLSKLIQRKRDDNVLKDIESKFCDILRNLSSVAIDGCDPFEGKKCLVNILFWCDSNVIKDGLNSGVLNEDAYPDHVKDYVLKVMNFKLNRTY